MTAEASSTHLAVSVTDHDHVRGRLDAPITLVEYGDYECSYCGTAYPVLKELRHQLGDRLRVVFRNFPCPDQHPHALQAAEAAEAAAAQGRFWEMHDLLFEHFWALEDADLARYAAELGLDVQRFERELAEHRYAARVLEDVRGGLRSGVSRTPTLFINGIRHGGFFSLPAMLEAIQAQVDEAGATAPLQADRETPAADVAADEVSEASWESFPASDAPAWRDHE